MFSLFFENVVLPKGLMFFFAALILEADSPLQLVEDFRPISLLGFQYDLVAYELAVRLAGVIDSLHYYENIYFTTNANDILSRLEKRGNESQHENLSPYPSVFE